MPVRVQFARYSAARTRQPRVEHHHAASHPVAARDLSSAAQVSSSPTPPYSWDAQRTPDIQPANWDTPPRGSGIHVLGWVEQHASAVSATIAANIALYRFDYLREAGDPIAALQLYDEIAPRDDLFEPWTLAGVALAIGAIGDIESAIEAAALAIASTTDRDIDAIALTQFGISLEASLVAWRQQIDPTSRLPSRRGAGRHPRSSGSIALHTLVQAVLRTRTGR